MEQQLRDSNARLQQAAAERDNISFEFHHMHQELQGQVAAKDGLNAKLQQLYSTIRDSMDDKQSVDRLFCKSFVLLKPLIHHYRPNIGHGWPGPISGGQRFPATSVTP